MQSIDKNIYSLSALEIVDNIKSRRLNATDIASVLTKRIKSLESKVRAWAYFNESKFIKQAESFNERLNSGSALGKLAAVPCGVKDIYNTFDMPTSMGSALWKNFTPGNDARIIFKFRDEGGLVAGKTNTAELAVHEPGPTRNPHNLNYYPGTSSSGSSAAVACGMVPVAFGTQTAGSIIRPASYCGVYGFKPTFGLIPRTGVLKTTDTLDQIGWFGRNIDDIKLLFDVLRVKGPNYPYVYKFIDKKYPEEFLRKKWKVGFVRHPKWKYVESYAERNFYGFVSKLSRIRTVDLKEVSLPSVFDNAHDEHDIIYNKELAYYFQQEYKNKKFLSKILSELIKRGLKISIEEYKKAQSYQVLARNRLDSLFKKYDVMITLSTSGEAPAFSNPVDKPDSCLIWTFCGVPVINVPVFKGPHGLPFGLQVIAKRYNDLLLLNFVKKLEKTGLAKALDPVEDVK